MPKFGKWTSVWGIVTILLIVESIIFAAILLFYRNLIIEYLDYFGWILLILSIYFALAPVYIFKKRAKVPKGKSYIHTKEIVDTDLFGIVRHPQYLSMLLVEIGLVLIVQHWAVLILSTICFILTYYGILKQDKILVRKFKDDYINYMKKVPRTNFLLGIIKKIFKRSGV
jgi:protein-S-isoprenylcysteine O-methyltransferase Ste14